jgi:hypothetical protein
VGGSEAKKVTGPNICFDLVLIMVFSNSPFAEKRQKRDKNTPRNGICFVKSFDFGRHAFLMAFFYSPCRGTPKTNQK